MGEFVQESSDQISDPTGDNPGSWSTNSDTVSALTFGLDSGSYGSLFMVVEDGDRSKLYVGSDGGDADGTGLIAAANTGLSTPRSEQTGYRGAIRVRVNQQGDFDENGEFVTPAVLDDEGNVIQPARHGYTHVTGLQFVASNTPNRNRDNGNIDGDLFGVTDDGLLLRNIDPGFRPATTEQSTEIYTNVDEVADLSSQLERLGATGFTGLAQAPRNLAGGIIGAEVDGYYADMFMATTDTGHIVFIDINAERGSEIVFVEQWATEANPDGWYGAQLFDGANPLGASTGLAVSPLDINLWHQTTHRIGETQEELELFDRGHGILDAPDGSRERELQDDFPRDTNNYSMYFGLENYTTQTFSNGGQFGVTNTGGYNWQQELTRNPEIRNNYNLAGGAYGTIETNSFSLDGYSYADKPTLLFNYWLDTEADTQSGVNVREMRDSARVFVSLDGGENWDVVATNNSYDVLNETSERPSFYSVSEEIVNTDIIFDQHVQELYDTTNGEVGSTWRQARVDLGRYHGETDIRLRFDFSTAGEFDENQTDADGNLINQIGGAGFGAAGISGKFIDENRNAPDNARERGLDNAFGGFFFDDIIVTTTERGEMVTGAAVGNTDFIDLETPNLITVDGETALSPQQLQGPYQLEIRRGTEYMLESGDIFRDFHTNESLTQTNTDGQEDPAANEYGPYLGDSNIIRQQGQFLIQNNIIRDAGEYAISIDAARDSTTGAPTSGVPMNRRVLNNARLVPGVVVTNNIVSNSGTAGILFSGDSNTGNVPEAAVPYGRLVNNTIYGGVQAATGIEVTDNAAPTLLNNVFASLATGVDVDGTSSSGTVIGTSAFHLVGTEVNGTTQEFGVTLPSDPFVNAAGGNFYPNSDSGSNLLVDSGLGSLQDRPESTVVTEDILIPSSPIIAPERDIFGQVRADDADVAGDPGLGTDIFVDRGAVERVDEIKPRASLVSPLDQSTTPPIDQSNETDVVRLLDDDAKGLFEFRIQLSDVGIGFDKTTVKNTDVTLSLNNTAQMEGEDYIFQYSKNLNQIILKSSSVYKLGIYEIILKSRRADAAAGVEAALTDLAGNPLLSNSNGEVKFRILLEGAPEAVGQVSALLDYNFTPPGPFFNNPFVQLSWLPPASAANPQITDYEIQLSKDGGPWEDVGTTTPSTSTTETIDQHRNGDPLEIGAQYVFRVRAVNAPGPQGIGPWSIQSAPVTPLRLPSAPQTLTVGPIFQGLDVSWTEPVDDGDNIVSSSALIDYRVEYTTDPSVPSGWTVYSPNPTSTSLALNGLTGGVGYHVRVSASNSRGYGAFVITDPNDPLPVPTSPPGPVEDLLLYSKVDEGVLDWDTPLLNGGEPIDGYHIAWNKNGTGYGTYIFVDKSLSTDLSNIDVDPGDTLQAKIYASSSLGDGEEIESNEIIIGDVPGSLTGLSFVEGDQSVELNWTAPTYRGYYGIVDYLIESSTALNGPWYPETITSTATSVTISTHNNLPLSNGTEYFFRVSVQTDLNLDPPNGRLAGTFSTPVYTNVAAIPHTAPSAPVFQSLTSGDRSITATWTALSIPENGGRPIADYEVQYKFGSRDWKDLEDVTPSPTPSRTIPDLRNGREYVVRVRAVNNVGLKGAWSDPSGIIVPGLVPSTPDVTATSLDAAVRLEWTVPSTTSPVTSQQIQYRKTNSPPWIDFTGPINSNGTTATATVDGLDNGDAYEFQVIATNNVGASEPQNPPVSATPFQSPGLIDSVEAQNIGTNVYLDWSDPTPGDGATIEDYRVQYKLASDDDESWTTYGDTGSTDSSVTISRSSANLTVGQTYVFQVAYLLNVSGQDDRLLGTYSQSNSLTVGEVGAAPQDIEAWKEPDVPNGNVQVMWDRVTLPDGVTFQHYEIQYQDVDSGDWTSLPNASLLTTMVSRTYFNSNTIYQFRVAMVTNTGRGAWGYSHNLEY